MITIKRILCPVDFFPASNMAVDYAATLAAKYGSTCALSGLDCGSVLQKQGGFEAAVRNYLTPEHRDDRAHGCLFAALGSDIVRQPRAVRHAMTECFRTAIDMLIHDGGICRGTDPFARG